MQILLSNDDGINAPGLLALAEALKGIGDVTVVAPHRERSTSGHSLTLHKPLRIKETQPGFYSVSGTPADCVYFATRHIMKQKPDLVVSGINRGANLGNDIFYSGTVAAAREGAYYGARSIAFSLCFNWSKDNSFFHWETAASFAKTFVPVALRKNLPLDHVLNVNVPNLPITEIKGVRMTTQGRRYYSDQIDKRQDPRGYSYYWNSGRYQGFEKQEGSDCSVTDQDFISVTPLRLDTTHYELMEELKKWEMDLQN